MRKIILLFLATALMPVCVFGQKTDIDTEWGKGLQFNSPDGNFSLKFGGRLQSHFMLFGQDDDLDNLYGEVDDASEFRRARLYTSGTVYKGVEYKLEFDFSNGSVVLTDVLLGIKDVPLVGTIRVGHVKEPFSLDMMTSSNNMTFIERASVVGNVKKQRNMGILVGKASADQRMTWAMGLFQNSDNSGRSLSSGKYNVTGRLTGLPWLNKEKNSLLHIGVAYSLRDPANDEFRLRSRPGTHLGPRYIDTETIMDVDASTMFGLELSLMANSFSMQAEYVSAGVQSVTDYNFSGYYVDVAYVLTGEHKDYSKKDAKFGRMVPTNNYGSGTGSGAWEVAARYSSFDLNDLDISGGKQNDLTLALVWHLNPSAKIAFNYSFVDIVDTGKNNIGQLKFQVAF